MAASLLLHSPLRLNPKPHAKPFISSSATLAVPRFPLLNSLPSRSSSVAALVSYGIRRRMQGLQRLPAAAEDRDGGGWAPGTSPENEGKEEEAEEARGQSTMPERFRHLNTEAPDRPLRWPWLIALAFVVYAWRSVLWEVTNWKNAALAVVRFFGHLLKLALAFLFGLIGDPITGLIQIVEFYFLYARSIYFNLIAFAPVPELARIILFTSAVLAIAETTVPDAINNQPYLLTFAGFIGFGAVKGFIPELLFWLLLSGMFCYSYFIKKRDGVSAALPSLAVLAAVGEPWVRALVMASYLSFAIFQHYKLSEGSVKTEVPANGRKLPVPLVLAALAIGINIAAKCVRHRHLTWMIV